MDTMYGTGFGNGELSDKARAIYKMRIAPTLTEADYGVCLRKTRLWSEWNYCVDTICSWNL